MIMTIFEYSTCPKVNMRTNSTGEIVDSWNSFLTLTILSMKRKEREREREWEKVTDLPFIPTLHILRGISQYISTCVCATRVLLCHISKCKTNGNGPRDNTKYVDVVLNVRPVQILELKSYFEGTAIPSLIRFYSLQRFSGSNVSHSIQRRDVSRVSICLFWRNKLHFILISPRTSASTLLDLIPWETIWKYSPSRMAGKPGISFSIIEFTPFAQLPFQYILV